MGDSEDHMRIGDRQKFVCSGRQPLVTRPAVTLGTMPIATRLEFDHLMGAVIALLYILAEGGGAARDDVPEGFPLLGRQDVSPAVEELLPVESEDIGDFQSMLGHCWRRSSLEWKIGWNESESRGLGKACRRCVETCR